MTKPDFFIVGAAKCGTTSMYRYLEAHPEVFMSAVKEPYFFCDDLEIADYWRVTNLEAYLALFRDAGEARRCGEASVWYLRSAVAAQRIREFAPGARIIAMLRNPVDMLFSLHGQFLRSSNEDILDFAEALAAEPDRRAGRRIPPKAHFPLGLRYSEMVGFSEQLRRYFDCFGRERVHVIVFDDLKEDTAGVYRRVLEFLDVDASFRPDFRRINAYRPIKINPVDYFVKDRPRLHDWARRLIPLALRRGIGRVVGAFVRPLPREATLAPALRAQLHERFADEIARLSVLLDRDLATLWRVKETSAGGAG